MPISRNFITILLLFTILSVTVKVSGQTFPMRTYSIDDGLTTSCVSDAIQDRQGLIWVSTDNGVSRYDGVQWKNYSKNEGVARCEYIQITSDNKNNIWILPILIRSNICYFNGSKWDTIPKFNPELVRIRYTSFAVHFNGIETQILAGTTAGIFSYKKNKWTRLLDPSRKLNCDIYSIKTYNGNFIIASKNGLFSFDGNSTFKNLLPEFNSSPEVLAIDITKSPRPNQKDQDVCWILTKSEIGYLNLSSMKYSHVEKSSPLKFLPRNKFLFIKYDGQQKIYYGNETYKFLIDLRFAEKFKIGMENGFSTTGNSNVMIDRERNVWFLSTRGIDKLCNLFFTNYNRSTGFKEDEVATFREIEPGKFFVGHNYGFTIFTLRSSKYYSIENKIPRYTSNCRIIDAAKDKDGNIWFAAGFLGIGKFDRKGAISWYRWDDQNQFGAVAINKEGKVFCGSDRALYRIDNDKLTKLKNENPNPSLIRKILFATDGKIYTSSNTSFCIYNKKGEFLKSISDDPRINSFYGLCEFDGNLLVGKPEGLFAFKNDRFEEYKFGSQKINQKIFFIENDKKGNLWFGTDDGIILWDGKNLRKFSKENGLMGRETNRSGFCADSYGRIWVGTEKGVSCYSNEYDNHEFKPSIINARLIDQFQNVIPIDSTQHQELNLTNNQNTFTLNFNAISYQNEEKIVYRVKLVGFEEEPIEFSHRNTIRYTNIPPGNYYFQIQAKNYNGNWNEIYKSANFLISPPFYKTWWFNILVIMLVGGVISWIFSYISKSKYSAELEKQVNIRTSELIESEAKTRAIIEHAPYLIMIISKDYKIKYVNKSSLPFSLDNSPGRSFTEYFGENELDSIKTKLKNLFEFGSPIHFEHNFREQSGRDNWMECYFNPIRHINEFNDAIGIFIDRTDMKLAAYEKEMLDQERAEAYNMLKKTLGEKEVLLKEVYHRVGNNLQVISSLLNLQAFYVDNKELSTLYKESLNRIKSMSMVHERLYQSQNLDCIKLNEYIHSLSSYLFERYEVYKSIDLQLDLDETIIEVDKAIPMGLIINELLTNTFKEIYDSHSDIVKKKKVFLSAKQTGTNLALTIEYDHNEDSPAIHKIQSEKSLGIRLTDLLVSQLGGTVQYQFVDCTKYFIQFPLSDKNDAEENINS